jgi:hypothetical protein
MPRAIFPYLYYASPSKILSHMIDKKSPDNPQKLWYFFFKYIVWAAEIYIFVIFIFYFICHPSLHHILIRSVWYCSTFLNVFLRLTKKYCNLVIAKRDKKSNPFFLCLFVLYAIHSFCRCIIFFLIERIALFIYSTLCILLYYFIFLKAHQQQQKQLEKMKENSSKITVLLPLS